MILGIDPGFASMGVAILSDLHREGGSPPLVFSEATVLRTKKNNNKVLSWDDNEARVRYLYRSLNELIRAYDVKLMAVEAESWTRMPSDKQLGLARGAIYGLSEQWELPIMQVTAVDMKHFLCDNKKASKQDVEEALSSQYPNLKARLNELPRTQRQHAADAAGCALYANHHNKWLKLLRRDEARRQSRS